MRSDDLIGSYLDRMAGAADAHHQDPLYHAQVHLLRRMLHLADMAMEDEGIEEERRWRVLRVVIYGGMPDEGAAAERMSLRTKQIAEAAKAMEPPTADEAVAWLGREKV